MVYGQKEHLTMESTVSGFILHSATGQLLDFNCAREPPVLYRALHKRIYHTHRWSRIRHSLEAKQFPSPPLLFQRRGRTRHHPCVRRPLMITVSQLLEPFDDSLPVIVISKDLNPVNEHKTIACQWRNSNIPVDRAGISPSRTLCIVDRKSVV